MTRSRPHMPSSTERRVCHSCHTDDTSQWRYGTNDVLLCNACGIRWKRQNRSSQSGRLKPGPKCTRPSSSSDTGDLGYRSHGAPVRGSKHSHGSSSGGSTVRSKMDLHALVDPSSAESPRQPSRAATPHNSSGHQHPHGQAEHGGHRACAHASPIAIRNLLNKPEENNTRQYVSGPN